MYFNPVKFLENKLSIGGHNTTNIVTVTVAILQHFSALVDDTFVESIV